MAAAANGDRQLVCLLYTSRQFQPKAPDEFYMFLGLQSVPPADPFPKEHWAKKMCALVVSHNGPLAEGEKACLLYTSRCV